MTKSTWCFVQLVMVFSMLSPGFFLPVPTCNAQTHLPAPPAGKDFKLSVSVNLVELHATVTSSKGRFVADLSQQHFSVFEDSVQQEIRIFQSEDIPVTVGLVVDHSGSMRAKITHVLAATRTFAEASKPDDQIFVVNFNEHVTPGLPPELPFTSDVDQLESAIQNAPLAGQTALYDAIDVGLNHVQIGKRDKKVLIVISDGGDNVSKKTLADLLKRAGQSSALIYTIAIFDENDRDRNLRILRQLASATGGAAFAPNEIKDIVSICRQIAREIRNQYTIGYVSSAPNSPGVKRRIRVTAKSPAHGKLMVRTRDSYTTASNPIREEDAKTK